ncbi:MAG: type II toxin-antitoxin system PemK/MazF family toxin [Candidatus Pacebacteria bacterium]|nr:type II toxin-antitoxin system PemK/MazF family toxin [Candidatus Paceibacterota bacterium]
MNSNKNFDSWNKEKKKVENRDIDNPKIMFCEKAIWWCSVGTNIGYEQDGKGKNFERPVLILRKFNKHVFLGIPLTTKQKNLDLPFYFKLEGAKVESIAVLSQIRLFSSKRLLREIEIIKSELFRQIKKQLKIIERL